MLNEAAEPPRFTVGEKAAAAYVARLFGGAESAKRTRFAKGRISVDITCGLPHAVAKAWWSDPPTTSPEHSCHQ